MPTIGLGMNSDDDSATIRAGSGPTVVGANALQKSIDQFDKAVTKLASLYDTAAKQAGGFASSGTSSGMSGPQSANAQGFLGQLTTNFSYLRSTFSTGFSSGGKGSGNGPTLPSGGSSGGGFLQSHPALAQISSGGLMVAGAAAAVGNSQLAAQTQISGFVQQQQLMLPSSVYGSGGSNNGAQTRIRNAAFGSNAIANNIQDNIAGNSIISSWSGASAGYANPMYNALSAAANQYGYATGAGYGASAQFAANQYNPVTSYNMSMMGLSNITPRKIGGGTRSVGVSDQGFLKAWTGSNVVDQSKLSRSLAQGTVGYNNVLNMYGGNQTQAAGYIAQLEQENLLATGNKARGLKGLSPAQQQQLLNNAAANKPGAQAELAKYGIDTTDAQKRRDVTSTQTARTANNADAYNRTLSTWLDFQQKYNNLLTQVLNLPGIKEIFGLATGAGGAIGTIDKTAIATGGAVIKGVSNVGKGIGKLFGLGGSNGSGATGGGGGQGGPGGNPLGNNTTALDTNTAALYALTSALTGQGGGPVNGAVGHATGTGKHARTPASKGTPGNKGRGTNGTGRDVGTAVGWEAGAALGSLTDEVTGPFGTLVGGFLGSKIGGWIGGHFADGGVVGGTDMGYDSKTINVRGGEGVLVPSAVRALGGPSAIHKINRRYGGGKKNKPSHYSQGGVVTGAEIDQYAEQFAGKTPYVWGGDSPSSGWDCSGMALSVYKHFGLANGMPRTSQDQWKWVQKTKTPEAGGLAFFAGSDGTQSSPGHVGIITGPNSMVDAYDTASGTMNNNIRGSSGPVTGYGIPPKGFKSSGAGNGTSGNNSTATSSSGSAATVSGSTLGLSPGSYGASNEVNTVMSALMGGGAGGPVNGGGSSSSGSSSSATSSGGKSVTSSGITNSSGMAALKAAAAKMGWTGAQWAALQGVEAIEDSSYSLTAKNPGSKAYGMAQFINGPSEYKQYGGNSTTYAGQATGMVNYVSQRYGTPEKALAHEHSFGYYAGGTSNASGGLAWVGERGPELMSVPAGTKVATNAASKNYAKGTAQTPWSAQLAGVSSGGTPGGCSGHSIQITFGDIQVGTSGGTSSGAYVQNAREFVREVKRQLEQEELFSNIATGVK
jgi:NlpC/P60 family